MQLLRLLVNRNTSSGKYEMNNTFLILTIVLIFIAIAMILIILVQRPQGGGLAAAFGGAGGGGTDTVFGGRVGERRSGKRTGVGGETHCEEQGWVKLN